MKTGLDGTPLRLLRVMLRIRLTEEGIAGRYAEQEMRCPVHLADGQEGVAAGVCLALRPDDLIIGSHRYHAPYLAKGGDLKAMLAEIYGKAAGCFGGRGGSMHLADAQAGILPSVPIIGSSVPLGVGAALAAKQTGQDRVAVAFFGDATVEEGVLAESMNFVALHALPVVFLCENNRISFYTPLEQRQPDRPISSLAAPHGIPAEDVDGNDVLAVHAATVRAVERARAGQGPTLLVCHTRRWREHCGPKYDAELGKVDPETFAQWRADCPIDRLTRRLVDSGELDEAALPVLREQIQAEVDDAFRFAKAAPFPDPDSAGRHIYG